MTDETPAAKPTKAETPAAKADRLAQEKDQLLRDIAVGVTGDLRVQVGYILNNYPDARDSDVTLTNRLWETFYPEQIEGEWVRLKALYELPRPQTITRTRAKIQNEYGLFLPSREVAGVRRTLQRTTSDAMVADKPGPPVIDVFADESGKNQPHLVVGSVWVVDVARGWRIEDALRAWKKEHDIKREFKFADLTKDSIGLAQGFVEKALTLADIIGFKACVLDASKVKGRATEDTLFRLYYELAVAGLEHEIASRRVELPRWLSFVKDADEGPDALAIPEFERRLTATCRDHFKSDVKVESIMSLGSHESERLQLADLFSGSIARVVNKVRSGTNVKDDFAAFFEKVAGFDFEHGSSADSKDSVFVKHLA